MSNDGLFCDGIMVLLINKNKYPVMTFRSFFLITTPDISYGGVVSLGNEANQPFKSSNGFILTLSSKE